MYYNISSEVSGFGSLQTHIHGQWPEAMDYYHKRYFVKGHLEEEGKCKFSS